MRLFLVLVGLCTLIGSAASAQSKTQAPSSPAYTFKSIDFPGAATTQAFGVNERGDVVGAYVDSSGNSHGFSWIDGRFASVDFPGAFLTNARGINDDATIVGAFTRADDPEGGHGFVLRDGAYTQVDFPGAAHSGILGINEGGDLTGSYDLGDINTGIGYFTDHGQFVSFEVPESAPLTTGPHAINDAGQVAGFFIDGSDPNITRGFIRYKGVFTRITYPGADITGIFGINERGDVVGSCTCVDGTPHGFLLARGTFTFIKLPGSTHTRPRGVNDRGQIVGFYDVAGVMHGFIATPHR